uniref:Uncharacterized protein n=1 Tax=Pseudomonas fluorescens (strain SBW25) TaxID=216595 RepID=A0A0G4E6G4_PSEFS|nr:hypothetical protein [Pseudomonas fluorescens]CEK42542.1 hypothetical protein PQBR55_0163 [Pseudomonas fluorescens SBW25]
MSIHTTESTTVLNSVPLTLEGRSLENLRRYREVKEQWLAATDGTQKSLKLKTQLDDLRAELASWLDMAVLRQERGEG